MKTTLIFKTPDVMDQLPECECDEEKEDEVCEPCKLKQFVCSQLRYNEYIKVEFDSVNKTITVK